MPYVYVLMLQRRSGLAGASWTVGFFILGYGLREIWYISLRKKLMDNALDAAYPDVNDDTFVHRPSFEKGFESVADGSLRDYQVIVGGRDSGKSTFMKRVARRTPGMIYIHVPDNSKNVGNDLESALRAALNWMEPSQPILRSAADPYGEQAPRCKRSPIYATTVPRTDQCMSKSEEFAMAYG